MDSLSQSLQNKHSSILRTLSPVYTHQIDFDPRKYNTARKSNYFYKHTNNNAYNLLKYALPKEVLVPNILTVYITKYTVKSQKANIFSFKYVGEDDDLFLTLYTLGSYNGKQEFIHISGAYIIEYETNKKFDFEHIDLEINRDIYGYIFVFKYIEDKKNTQISTFSQEFDHGVKIAENEEVYEKDAPENVLGYLKTILDKYYK